MLRRLTLGLMLVGATFASHSVDAQAGSISGRVVSVHTGLPVAGAAVSVAGSGFTVLTRSSGTFTILGVPVGRYTLTVRARGYVSQEMSGVTVDADRTRNIRFELRVGRSTDVDRLVVQPGLSYSVLTAAMLALGVDDLSFAPSVDLSGALGITGGYADLPASNATLSLPDYRRGLISTPSVRGSRPEQTQFMLEGISVSNPVFGNSPLLIEPIAASNVSFMPAYLRPEYGNASAGVVAQTVREGEDAPKAALEYGSGWIPTIAGSQTAAASGASVRRGYVSGAVPGTNQRVRLLLAGHSNTDQMTVMRDANGAWRGVGGVSQRQGIAKVSFAVQPTLTLSATAVSQRRSFEGSDTHFIRGQEGTLPSVREDGRFIAVRGEKRFSGATISLVVAENRSDRQSCSLVFGRCMTDPPQRVDQFLGGESFATRTFRADVAWQASDHHQIQFGAYGARHAISYEDVTSYRSPSGLLRISRDAYRASPLELATYAQSVIERDFITIHAGARFDFANTGGFAFNDLTDPTNGTTAREVCNGLVSGINETAFTYAGHVGFAACEASPKDENGRQVLVDSASRLAQLDDFHPVRSRATFSPRLSVRLPLTERVLMYLNAGRYSTQPRYHDVYRHTHTGLLASMDPKACPSQRAIMRTDACSPSVALESSLPDFLGNPELSAGRSVMWEAGITSRIDARTAMELSFFSGTHALLPVLTSHTLDDPGTTYGALTDATLRTVDNLGTTSSFGLSWTLRRQSPGVFSYVVNYSWQESSDLGVRPDFAAEAFAAGVEFGEELERVPGLIRPHSVSAQFTLRWRDRTPSGVGPLGRILLRDSRTVVGISAASSSGTHPLDETTCAELSTQCGDFSRRVPGTGKLINLLYVRSLNSRGPVVSLTFRVRNLLDADDGSTALAEGGRGIVGVPGLDATRGKLFPVSRRRILTGLTIVY